MSSGSIGCSGSIENFSPAACQEMDGSVILDIDVRVGRGGKV